jgi:hypothetical protein
MWFFCRGNNSISEEEGKTILLPASCDAGKNKIEGSAAACIMQCGAI